jgi:hypothetical protein
VNRGGIPEGDILGRGKPKGRDDAPWRMVWVTTVSRSASSMNKHAKKEDAVEERERAAER